MRNVGNQHHDFTNSMKPQDIFKLAVRLLGLVFLYHVLQMLPMVVGELCQTVARLEIVRAFLGIVMIGWPLAVAYWLLRGAPLIMRIAYPEAPVGPKEETRIGGALAKNAEA